jgi:3-deoxy-manno-octulosonate cytidylyltransferase (CMP-KDO synthetase)
MNKTAIIIPSRLDARRFPNKPLKLINKKEMILHVYDAAIKSKAGEVFVASPDEEIIDRVKKYGGNAIKTSNLHKTGTDRVYEVFNDTLKKDPAIIINLQGDMPNIDPNSIYNLVSYMHEKKCDIGTLASKLNKKIDIENPNIVKVAIKEKFSDNAFLTAVDFSRKNINSNIHLYHHIGIYAFTNKALVKYVNLKRSKNEVERNLEQLRALDNKMSIHVGYINSSPLSVDTEEDLIEIKKLMEKNEKN